MTTMTPPTKKQSGRFWEWMTRKREDRSWARLTCDGEMGVGPRRLLLVISFPFFLCWIIPGILFWLVVRLVLWVVNGFRQDKRSHDSTQKKDT
jgi:hypothetical protein